MKNMERRHVNAQELINHGPSIPLPDPATVDRDLAEHPPTEKETEAFKIRDAVRASTKTTREQVNTTHYGLPAITQEQIDAHKIQTLRRQIEESDSLEGSMDAAAALKHIEEKGEEPTERPGLLTLPTQSTETVLQQVPLKKPSPLKRITRQITDLFKRAA